MKDFGCFFPPSITDCSRLKLHLTRPAELDLGFQISQGTVMSYLKAYAVAIVSALSGAAVVHNIVQPDLVRLATV